MVLEDLIKVMAPEQQFKVINRNGHCGGAIYQKKFFDRELSDVWKKSLSSQVSTVHTTEEVIFIWLRD